jgi:AcrR family transcriptional regulator
MAKRAKPISPIWTRPAPGTRRPRLTREQIAEAALAIADAEGFDEVSMRRIAAELGAGTMTLYYYVKTKDDLIALMDDAIMAEVVLPEIPAGWRAGVMAIARASRDVFVRHPWALYALQGARIGPNGLRHMEQSLAAVVDAPTDLKGKLRLLSIVDDYMFGHVLRVSESWTHPMDAKVMTMIAEFFEAQLATGDYPQLSAMIGGEDVFAVFTRLARWMAEDARFDAGLHALLDGLERQMLAGELSAASPPAPAPPRGPLGDALRRVTLPRADLRAAHVLDERLERRLASRARALDGRVDRREGRAPEGRVDRREGRAPEGRVDRREGRAPEGRVDRREGRAPEGRVPEGRADRREGRPPRRKR